MAIILHLNFGKIIKFLYSLQNLHNYLMILLNCVKYIQMKKGNMFHYLIYIIIDYFNAKDLQSIYFSFF